MHKITVIHPSRGRAQMAFNTAKLWLDNADCPEKIGYNVSIDLSDPSAKEYSILASENIGHVFDILMSDNRSAIDAINNAADFCVSKTLMKDLDGNPISRQLIVVVSDDFSCEKGWDMQLIAALAGKSDFIVKTMDGIQKTLITLPIMDEFYYNRFGYIYHPEYKHMFCDQEMTAVAEMTGKVINLPLMFPHNHYTTGAMQKDQINVKNDSTWTQGSDLFNQRLKSNFGLKPEEIVKPYTDIVWH